AEATGGGGGEAEQPGVGQLGPTAGDGGAAAAATGRGGDAETDVRSQAAVGQVLTTGAGDLRGVSAGSAGIATGAADASGNESAAAVRQSADHRAEALGAVVVPQLAGVGNVGVAGAGSGENTAVGNERGSTVTTA